VNVGFVFPVSMSEELLNIKNVSKAYAGVQALDSVSMLIRRGEIHCLVGENGSGKSTLIKTLAGVVRIDSGEILINGRPYRHLRAIDAIREGIQVIYQDLSLYPRLTVAENISLNQMVEKGCKLVRWKEVKTIARQELYKIGVNIDIDAPVEDLSMANKQIVAIVRALTQNARLMVMDEPTTALTKNEIDSLFAIILECRSRGISTLFVSHKLSEVLEISEKVTVLRDGRKVGEFTREELDTDKLIFHMTGKTILESKFEHQLGQFERRPLLELSNLTRKKNYEAVGLKLYPGEIVGITGLLGSGRTELALSIFGLNPPDSGEIRVDGKRVDIQSPAHAVQLGIGFLPEDRHIQGLFLQQSIANNIIATILHRLLNRVGLISSHMNRKIVRKSMEEFRIRAPSPETSAESLSGGNQQRVVLAKWMATHPKIFILDSPTVGIDIASKAEIHTMIRLLAQKGMGIIIISDEISEVLRNCNRILVMSIGRIVAEVDARSTTEAELFELMSFKRRQPAVGASC
jgi:simple sugar transport system ATP-binding protein